MLRRRVPIVLLAAAAAALALLAGALVARAPGPEAAAWNGTVMQPPLAIEDFALTAHHGGPVRLSDFRGEVVLLFFGFASCPDVCPATLSEVDRALASLGPERAGRVQVLFVSVDPERDTPAALADYVTHFDPSFLGATGTPEQIAAAESRFGAYHTRRESEAGETTFDHTARLSLIDPEGALRLSYGFGFRAEELAADLRRLLPGPDGGTG